MSRIPRVCMDMYTEEDCRHALPFVMTIRVNREAGAERS